MAVKIGKWVIAALGIFIGPAFISLFNSLMLLAGKPALTGGSALVYSAYAASSVVFFILFYLLAPALIHVFGNLVKNIESGLNELPVLDLALGLVGLLLGLVIAFLLSGIIRLLPIPGAVTAITIFVYVLLGALGWSVAIKRRFEVRGMSFEHKKDAAADTQGFTPFKLLDTSVIIDGRIFDICRTGVIEGTLIIPNFVLSELRHIADSADSLKRNRGRRGLDILNKIQKELDIPVMIEERDYDDIAEVDAKLLKLAQDMSGTVVTNDYNLNKVAAVQGVRVLNINELANAVKPVVLPGEEMRVQIVKEGKEYGQGVAYLDDGTMIVVDNGRRHINQTLDVIVTSVLQTAAGRMIFAKLR